MTKYACGHEVDTIIMNTNALTLSNYMSWKDTNGYDGDKSQCYDCYCKELNKKSDKELVTIVFDSSVADKIFELIGVNKDKIYCKFCNVKINKDNFGGLLEMNVIVCKNFGCFIQAEKEGYFKKGGSK